MNRTDRLYALVEELRARAPRQVGRDWLAERFEVHSRTIERDMSALQQAGVPIWSQRGPSGGYAIDPDFTLPPLSLTALEATAVAIALAAAGDVPYAQHARSAAAKVAAVLTGEDVATGVGGTGSGDLAARIRITRNAPSVAPPIARAVEHAVANQRVAELDYVDRHGRATHRSVECHGFYRGEDHWYVIGWCRLRHGGRIFRLDRITSVRVTGEPTSDRDIDQLLGWVPGQTQRPSLLPIE